MDESIKSRCVFHKHCLETSTLSSNESSINNSTTQKPGLSLSTLKSSLNQRPPNAINRNLSLNLSSLNSSSLQCQINKRKKQQRNCNIQDFASSARPNCLLLPIDESDESDESFVWSNKSTD